MCIAAWQWGGRPHAGLDSPDGREVTPQAPGGGAAARGAMAGLDATAGDQALSQAGAAENRLAHD